MTAAAKGPAHRSARKDPAAQFVGRRPEEEGACIGQNHVPGCEHFPAAAPIADVTLEEVPLDLVDVGDNVRVTLEAIDELAASIAEHGVLQPVKATLMPGGRYRLLWGQRRVLAARQAGLSTVPALVSRGGDVDDRPIEQLVENLHRADLNPIDRARAMRAVVDAGVSQADLARKLGIGSSTVSNDLRLLTLAEPVLERIRAGEISPSHGKAIASLPAKQQAELAERVVQTAMPSKDLERELEWKRADADADVAKAKRTEKVLPRLVPALEAAKVPKGAEVYISRGEYSYDVAAMGRAVADAGFRPSRNYRGDRPAKGECDCTCVRVELGRSVKVVPACADDRHRDRQRNLDRSAEIERDKASQAKLDDLGTRVLARLAGVDVAVLILVAAGHAVDLPELLAGEGDPDRAQLRALAARRLAANVDPSRAWGESRAKVERALDAILAMLPEATA